METVFEKSEEKMEKRMDMLNKDFISIRAGRANPAILDRVTVDYYGAATPINQLAAIAVSEARTLTIQPWDASVVKMVEKAIQASDIGINPQTDGKIIRLIFPPLTEDRRKDLVKDINKMSEEAKVSIRSIRRDMMDKFKKMEKKSEITEDDLKDCEKRIQKMTDKFIKEIDDMRSEKEKEILEI